MLYHDRRSLSKMGAQERRLFRKGFPAFAVQHELGKKTFTFQDYSYGTTTPKSITAIQQARLLDIDEGLMESSIFVFYEETVDYGAFRAAGYLALRIINHTRSIECISVMDIVNNWREIPKALVYFIYGIDNEMSPGTASAVRSFLYARDGSMRILIVAGNGAPRGPWDIVAGKLHVAMDFLFVLATQETHNSNVGKITKVASKNVMHL